MAFFEKRKTSITDTLRTAIKGFSLVPRLEAKGPDRLARRPEPRLEQAYPRLGKKNKRANKAEGISGGHAEFCNRSFVR